MPTVQSNNITLFYEDHGDLANPPILLIMGLGMQLIAWPDAFVIALVAAGFRVIRFDNRDTGKSTWFKGQKARSPALMILATKFGLHLSVPYTLTDMADDAIGLLDALGIPAAHIVGASMGGMIAQIVATKAPERVLSLTSIMSSSGARGLPAATPEVQQRLLAPAPKNATREQLIQRAVDTLTTISYPDPARPADAYQLEASLAYERGSNPAGFIRQLAAIINDGSRVKRLARIKAPTLVIHGRADNLVPLPCGVDTAKHIANARLEIIDAMAHDLPPSQIPHLADLISAHARSATSR